MIFSDAHIHTNPIKGLGAKKISEKLKELGFWFIAIVSLTPRHYNLKPTYKDFVKMVELTIHECRDANEVGVKAVCLAGIHPSYIDLLINSYRDLEKTYSFAIKALNYIERKLKDQEVIGIGEVGRQHYPVNPVNIILSEAIMEKAMEIARDYDAIIHLHLERGGGFTVNNIIDKIKKIGIERRKVVIHHADRQIAEASRLHGVSYTVIGKAELIGSLNIKTMYEMMIESDYLDDPNRRCVAMCPWDIPNNIKELKEHGYLDDKVIQRVFIDNISKVYNIEY